MTLSSHVFAAYFFRPEGRQPERYQHENISWCSILRRKWILWLPGFRSQGFRWLGPWFSPNISYMSRCYKRLIPKTLAMWTGEKLKTNAEFRYRFAEKAVKCRILQQNDGFWRGNRPKLMARAIAIGCSTWVSQDVYRAGAQTINSKSRQKKYWYVLDRLIHEPYNVESI